MKYPNALCVLSHPALILSTALTLAAGALQAEVKLPSIFGDHMVLQREMPVPVWGTDEPGTTVTITFKNQTVTTVADAKGDWEAELTAMDASKEPAVLTVKGTSTETIEDVLVGEVWLCGGQSNMEWVLKNTNGADEVMAASDYPTFRQIKMPHVPSDAKMGDISASWDVCTPESSGNFTAVGYYFGRAIKDKLDVPVGLINCNWGGTRIEPWIPREGFEMLAENNQDFEKYVQELDGIDNFTPARQQQLQNSLQQLKDYVAQAEKDIDAEVVPQPIPSLPGLQSPDRQQTSRLYRGMTHTFVPYALRGAIWYQGESNAGQPDVYAAMMEGLVKGWRQVWGQGDFPFYYVQLANYQGDKNTPEGGDGYARLREAQFDALEIDNTGMAVIIDIGETNDIHPRNKQDVGQRLAAWALTQTYGQPGVPSGPLYQSAEVEGSTIRVTFDYVGDGLMVGKKDGMNPVVEDQQGKLARFAIAGENKQWYWADAAIDGDTVVVSSPDVPQPKYVRYAYSGNPLGANLYNRDGMPAGPFRTDR